MATRTVLSLASGVGGMDLGFRILGYRTVGYVEREAFAAATLVARMEDKALDPAPIWDDLTTFDGLPWCGKVDWVASGLPCQPYSVAGKQRGNNDERALWPHFVRIIEECEPGGIFLENVTGFLKHLEPVYKRLRGLGFEFAPPLLHTASESGAPHIRRRLFVAAAHPERIDLRNEPWRGCGSSGGSASGPGHTHDPDPNTNGERRSREWGGWVFDGERETLRHNPNGCGDGCGICGTPWEAESPPVRVADGPPNRVDELRAIGNVGTPPLVYANAFRLLTSTLCQ